MLWPICEVPTLPTEYFQMSFLDLLKEMLPLLKSVLTNPVLVLIVLGSITDSFVVSAFAAFLPKIVESQFGFVLATKLCSLTTKHCAYELLYVILLISAMGAISVII